MLTHLEDIIEPGSSDPFSLDYLSKSIFKLPVQLAEDVCPLHVHFLDTGGQHLAQEH